MNKKIKIGDNKKMVETINMAPDKFTTEDEESLGKLITWLARIGEELDSSKIADIVKLIDKKMEW